MPFIANTKDGINILPLHKWLTDRSFVTQPSIANYPASKDDSLSYSSLPTLSFTVYTKEKTANRGGL